ncbi:helix-turn-helix transcriptional regulator [Kibdelosporangium aridum]|uniref:Helix-turn-helix transcriptional regulator n=2 Tax=Kibdelosporangium aridum TaxID=2030 RepID=A0A428ZV06_KIBAR|nr:helix-turn-helix transcriptional regulator [Kibdelosporangium aridum]
MGSGPPLIAGGWWCCDLEQEWQMAAFRKFMSLLAGGVTLIRYGRAIGPSLEDQLATLDAVVTQVGAPVSLLGASSGGCVSAAYAALYPDRVDRLVLYGAYAYGAEITTPEAQSSIVDILGRHWGVGSRFLADLFLPDSSAEDRTEFIRFQRATMSPAEAATALQAVYKFDVREHLRQIEAPTLVLHRRNDRVVPFRLGRSLASTIPGATLVPLDGVNHMPWAGDSAAIAEHTFRFLGAAPSSTVDTMSLSTREIDVLRLVAAGMSDQEIAQRLTLSAHTVHRHVANIRTKLGLPSRTAAAAHAARSGLI